MNEAPRSWRLKLWRLLKTFGWLILLVLIAQQVWWAPFRADAARARVIERFQQERKSRVIAMIHRQDTQSLFGVPVSQSITIDDSEAILRAIRLTQPEQPLDLILHTPGGLRSEEHTSELQSQSNLVCRLLLEKKKNITTTPI